MATGLTALLTMTTPAAPSSASTTIDVPITFHLSEIVGHFYALDSEVELKTAGPSSPQLDVALPADLGALLPASTEESRLSVYVHGFTTLQDPYACDNDCPVPVPLVASTLVDVVDGSFTVPLEGVAQRIADGGVISPLYLGIGSSDPVTHQPLHDDLDVQLSVILDWDADLASDDPVALTLDRSTADGYSRTDNYQAAKISVRPTDKVRLRAPKPGTFTTGPTGFTKPLKNTVRQLRTPGVGASSVTGLTTSTDGSTATMTIPRVLPSQTHSSRSTLDVTYGVVEGPYTYDVTFQNLTRVNNPYRSFTTSKPRINGTPAVGRLVSVLMPASSPAATTLEYRWTLDGKTVPGATARKYRLKPADAGKDLRAYVTGRRAGYTTVTRHTAAATVRRGTLGLKAVAVGRKVYRGPLRVGEELHARASGVAAVPGLVRRATWFANGKAVQVSTTTQKYTVRPTDLGKRISLEVRVSAPGYYAAERTSPRTNTVKPAG